MSEELLEKFGHVIRERRLKQNLSQEYLADYVPCIERT